MSWTIAFRDEVPGEINEAIAWYDRQADGLGREFATELKGHLDKIADQPMLYAIEYRNIRSAPMRRFPFVVYYRIEAAQLLVAAILHGRADPRRWRRRA